VKIRIDVNERYPVFFRAPDRARHGARIEVPDEVVKKWEQAQEEFNQMQDEMAKYLREE